MSNFQGVHTMFKVLASPALAADPTRMSERLQTWHEKNLTLSNMSTKVLPSCPTYIYSIDSGESIDTSSQLPKSCPVTASCLNGSLMSLASLESSLGLLPQQKWQPSSLFHVLKSGFWVDSTNMVMEILEIFAEHHSFEVAQARWRWWDIDRA